MAILTDNRQIAIRLVEQIPEESLDEVIDLLNALHRQTSHEKPLNQNTEDQLLQIIHRKLLHDEQVRLDYLREQNESEEITELEHQELLAFVSRVENEDAERAAAILQLGQIHKCDNI